MTDLHKDCPTDITLLRQKYNYDRFQQLNGLLGQASSSTWTYLLTVNGGGAAALLALIGSESDAARYSWPYWILMFFVLGLVCVGFAHAFIVHKLDALSKHWVEATGKYWHGKVGWAIVIESDDSLVKKNQWVPWVLGWLSLFFFLTGVAWAAYEFRALALAKITQ